MRLANKEKDQHLQFAWSLNGLVWELLGKGKLSKDNIELMIHAAHGSCFHWLKAGMHVNHQRALWLFSRVYGVTGLAILKICPVNLEAVPLSAFRISNINI